MNRSVNDSIDLNFEISGFETKNVVETIEIHNDSLDAVNTEQDEKVKAAAIPGSRYAIAGNTLNATLVPASWNMFRISLKQR